MKASMEHIRTVCKLGQGEETCKYLGANSKGWECLKTTNLKDLIDQQNLRAKGDNCDGKEN